VAEVEERAEGVSEEERAEGVLVEEKAEGGSEEEETAAAEGGLESYRSRC
jgi:hypothetical protein